MHGLGARRLLRRDLAIPGHIPTGQPRVGLPPSGGIVVTSPWQAAAWETVLLLSPKEANGLALPHTPSEPQGRRSVLTPPNPPKLGLMVPLRRLQGGSFPARPY